MLLLLCALLGLVSSYLVWSCDRDLRALRNEVDDRRAAHETSVSALCARVDKLDAYTYTDADNQARYIEERVRPPIERIDATLAEHRRSLSWINEQLVAHATNNTQVAYDIKRLRELLSTSTILLGTLAQRVDALAKEASAQ